MEVPDSGESTESRALEIDRRRLLQITGVLGAGGLAGCSSGDGSGSDGGGGGGEDRLDIAVATGPNALDPHTNQETTTETVYIHFYDAMVARNQDMEIVPRLAESWEQPDDTTWVFDLREDVTFENGEPFNAEIVQYNIRRLTGELEGAEEVQLADRYKPIENTEILDDHRIQFNLKQPQPLFLQYQAQTYYLPKKFTQENGFEALNENPIGTGAYNLKEWQRDTKFVMTARDDYFRGKASIERVVWTPMPETSSRLSALISGDADIIRSVAPTDVPRVENNQNTEIRMVPSSRSALLFMNMEQEIPGRDDSLFYKNPELRKAVVHAIDYQSIIENVLGGFGEQISGIAFDETIVGHNPNIESYPFDLEKAKSLIDEAGYPDGFDAQLLVPRGRYFKGVSVAEAIATMLGEIGINIELDVVDYGTFAEQTFDHIMPEFMFAGWGTDTFHALDPYTILVKSDSFLSWYPDPGEGQPDWVRQSDQLIEEARTTGDQEKVEAILQEAEALNHEHAPYAYLYQTVAPWGVNKELDWQSRADEKLWVYPASY